MLEIEVAEEVVELNLTLCMVSSTLYNYARPPIMNGGG